MTPSKPAKLPKAMLKSPSLVSESSPDRIITFGAGQAQQLEANILESLSKQQKDADET